MGGGATGGGMAGGAMGGGMGGGAMGGGMGGGATGGGLGGGTGGGMDAGPVYDIPNGVELLRESFDDSNFPTRGWYGVGAATIVAQTAPDGGAGAFQCAFISGATACTNGTPGRHLFTATETLYIRSWVRFGPGWSGSGSNTTFPVVFNVLTDADSMYIGPGSTVLTIEANIVANRVQLGVHDGANVNPACVLWDDGGFSGCGGNPSTYVFTESRSVAACNGFVGALHLHHCELFGTEYFSGRSWMPPTPWFTDAAGPRYESDWHLFESYFQMNTVQAGIGVPDGKLRAWLDGQRVLTVDQVLFRTGARPNIKFNQFLVVGYIGNGSPAAQEYYLDELVVGTGLLP
jgi:hypothetical protein